MGRARSIRPRVPDQGAQRRRCRGGAPRGRAVAVPREDRRDRRDQHRRRPLLRLVRSARADGTADGACRHADVHLRIGEADPGALLDVLRQQLPVHHVQRTAVRRPLPDDPLGDSRRGAETRPGRLPLWLPSELRSAGDAELSSGRRTAGSSSSTSILPARRLASPLRRAKGSTAAPSRRGIAPDVTARSPSTVSRM